MQRYSSSFLYHERQKLFIRDNFGPHEPGIYLTLCQLDFICHESNFPQFDLGCLKLVSFVPLFFLKLLFFAEDLWVNVLIIHTSSLRSFSPDSSCFLQILQSVMSWCIFYCSFSYYLLSSTSLYLLCNDL